MAKPHAAKRKERMETPFGPGEYVIIRSNPHDTSAENIVGIVATRKPKPGVGGCVLVNVKYSHPRTGKECVDPFCPPCLDQATPPRLIQLAEYHKVQATRLREFVAAIRQSAKSR
jgi:hypothetical protein